MAPQTSPEAARSTFGRLTMAEYRRLAKVRQAHAERLRARYATPQDLVHLRFMRWLYLCGRLSEDL